MTPKSIALSVKSLRRALKYDQRLRNVRVCPFDGWHPTIRGGSIVNTSKKGVPGRHWVAFWVTGGDILFFDSGGQTPKRYNFDVKGYRVEYNGIGWQSPGTYYCGYYCLFFLWHASRGFSKLMSTLRSDDRRRNDYLVYGVCHRIFRIPEVLI